MKKLLALVITLTMALSVFSVCLFAEEEEKEPMRTTATVINPLVDIYKIGTAPKRDGVVSAGEYGDKIHTTYEAGKEGEFDYNYNFLRDVDADFYACWDDRNLYLAWVVRTDHHRADTPGQGMWIWNCVQFEVCDRDPRLEDRVVLSLGCAPGTGAQAGKQFKELYSSGGQIDFSTFFRSSMWQFTGKRDDAAQTTTYEVSIPWTTLNTVSINGYNSLDTDTTGFAALGGEPQEGMVFGLGYVVNDTTGVLQQGVELLPGEPEPEYDPNDMDSYVGFWADQRHSVQWGSSILGGYDHDDFLADSMMAVATLRGVKGADDGGDEDDGQGGNGSQDDNQGSSQGGNQSGNQDGNQDGNTTGGSNPSTGTPSTGEPATGEPSTGVPETGAPATDVPETLNPVTDEPQTPDVDEPTNTDPEDEGGSLLWLWIVIGVVAAAAIAAIVIVLVKKKGGSDGDTPDGPTDGSSPEAPEASEAPETAAAPEAAGPDAAADGSAADSAENTEASSDSGADDK